MADKYDNSQMGLCIVSPSSLETQWLCTLAPIPCSLADSTEQCVQLDTNPNPQHLGTGSAATAPAGYPGAEPAGNLGHGGSGSGEGEIKYGENGEPMVYDRGLGQVGAGGRGCYGMLGDMGIDRNNLLLGIAREPSCRVGHAAIG